MSAVVLLMSMFLSNQPTFAGDSGCQSGRLANNNNNYGRTTGIAEQERQFQAAQIRNSGNQPPAAAGTLSGGDSEMRSQISYFASLFFLCGGIWLLFSLARERWLKRYAPKSTGAAKVWNFVLKPSFALSMFAVLFATVVAGSVLTAPPSTFAQNDIDQKEPATGKETVTRAGTIVNQPVFTSAQQIGGDGTTQIGAPVYGDNGDYYVRGAFSGTLTLGETTLTATQGLDMFVAKYDENENLLWVRQGSGMTNAPNDELATEGATAMAAFVSENGTDLYVAGSFVKTLTLQGGANPNVTLTDDGAAGYNYEAFLAKYDANGNLLWARGGNSGSPKNADNLEIGQNTINRIVFDRFGAPYVGGIISGANFLGAPISNFTCNTQQPCAVQGRSDILLAYINGATGAPQGVKVIGGAGDDNGLDLAIDNVTDPNNPKFYLVGNTDSAQIYFAVTGGAVLSNPDNSIRTFILRFGSFNLADYSDGNWVKVLDNDNLIGVNQIVTDSLTGIPFITGYYKGTLTAAQNSATLTNTRTGTNDAALAGYVAQISTEDGSFQRIAGLGGVGNSLTISEGGNLFVVGSIWNTGAFTSFSSSGQQTQTLDSFGGNDLFVAEINRFQFDFVSLKAVAGTGYQGLVAVGNPAASDGATKNSYSPLAITLDQSRRTVISGDFGGTLSLDCLTLTTPGASRHAYIAKVSFFQEPTSCRIWTNSDSGNRNWNEPSNWNGGIIPANGDSVYAPYRRQNVFNPIYNLTTDLTLENLSISDNQTLFLQRNLNIANRLDLLGGIISAGGNTVSLSPFSQPLSINGGRVIGRVQKTFFGGVGTFVFPVGTANGYSPVTISSNEFFGETTRTFAVAAKQGAYPNQAENLPTDRANRWWNLTNGGLTQVDLTFKYLPGDITTGTESEYRAYRIPTGGGTAVSIPGTINTTAKTVFAPNVSQFSDWTLAQPLVPTAASASVSGRVLTTRGFGVSAARVTLRDGAGNERQTTTNSFGYYRFDEIATSATYLFTVKHKTWGTNAITQVRSVQEDVHDLDFIAPQ